MKIKNMPFKTGSVHINFLKNWKCIKKEEQTHIN